MALERGDTLYRFNGQYYVKGDFPGTYQPISLGSTSKRLVANNLVTIQDLTPEQFKEEPDSKSEIEAYYQEKADLKIQEAQTLAQAGTITWDQADEMVREAEANATQRNTSYWDKRAAERAAQEQRNLDAGTFGGSGSGASGGTGSGGGLGGVSTGNPVLDATLGSLEKYLKELEKRGKVLNPNIQLDAKTLAQFTKQAEQEINPYYSSQLKLARESLLSSAGYSRDDVLRTEEELERQYKTQFKELGESAADRGFAQSGIRNVEEQELAGNTQRTVDDNRRKLEFNVENSARQFAQAYGSKELPSVSIGERPLIGAGETGFSKQAGSRQLYSLDSGIYDSLIGSQEFERRGAVKSRSSELESAFRSNQALQQQRSLTL